MVCQNIYLIFFHKTIICTIIVFLEDVTIFYSRTDAFKYSFFPSKKLEWNKLERKIRQSSILLTFRNSLLKIGRHAPKPVYKIHNANVLKLLTRLRLGITHLNEQKFNHNFKDCVNLLCSCSLELIIIQQTASKKFILIILINWMIYIILPFSGWKTRSKKRKVWLSITNHRT